MAVKNGQLPATMLASIPWDRAERMIPAAVHDLIALNQAFRARFGHDLIINEAYRSLATQQAYYKNPPSGVGTAAKPGTSTHGWGKAIDLHLTSTEYAWMRANASTFGFVNPTWAHDGKGIEEPWHWEHASATTVVPDVVVPAVIAATPRPVYYQEDTMTSFVTEALTDAYTTECGRVPSDPELAPRRLRIALGQSTLAAEITTIDKSVESGRYAVHQMYLELLKRDGSVPEWDGWIAATGNDIARIRAGIIASPEYKKLHP